MPLFHFIGPSTEILPAQNLLFCKLRIESCSWSHCFGFTMPQAAFSWIKTIGVDVCFLPVGVEAITSWSYRKCQDLLNFARGSYSRWLLASFLPKSALCFS